MKFYSFINLHSDTQVAAVELAAKAATIEADLAVMFASHHHEDAFDQLLQSINADINVRNLIGCTGESIVGPDSEVEGQPAVVLWLASLPDVRVLPFVVDQDDLQRLDTPAAWWEHLAMKPQENPSFVILADPFEFDILTCLQCMDDAYPQAPKVGGMASGASQPGQNRFFLNDQLLQQGMVGVALSGPIQIDTVVSQGCRPIGKPFVVTKAFQNIIEELGGHVPYEVLKQVFVTASSDDQVLMRKGVHVGVAVDEHVPQYTDFLVHHLLGIYDEDKLAINSLIRPGQTIQFHVRDASTADEDMRSLLQTKQQQIEHAPAGGLLFSCNGRGRRMFDMPNHDISLVNESFRGCKVAGFFAQGEIGPIGGQTFVHGYTSSLILFRERQSV